MTRAITQPRVSVVICTYTAQRLPLLLQALAAVRGQTVGPVETVVVVDYNEPLLDELRTRGFGVEVIANSGPRGASGARNAGIARTNGEIVAFLDDDAIPDHGWLSALLEPYRDTSVIAVGGPSEPLWQHGRPLWFPEAFHWVVSCSIYPPIAMPCETRNLWGVNMSVRRAALDAAGGFDPEFGPHGTAPGGCEEVELCIRMRRILPASRIIFNPAAKVRHHIPAARASRRYFLVRCYREGRYKAQLASRGVRLRQLRIERAFLLHLFRLRPRRALPALLQPHRTAAALERAALSVCGIAAACGGYLSYRLPGTHATHRRRRAGGLSPRQSA